VLTAVVASEKGVVVGRLTFTEDGDDIDCRRMGVGGKAIPPNISKVGDKENLCTPICTPSVSCPFSTQ
jgi:DNA topoisomerase VI subunit A